MFWTKSLFSNSGKSNDKVQPRWSNPGLKPQAGQTAGSNFKAPPVNLDSNLNPSSLTDSHSNELLTLGCKPNHKIHPYVLNPRLEPQLGEKVWNPTPSLHPTAGYNCIHHLPTVDCKSYVKVQSNFSNPGLQPQPRANPRLHLQRPSWIRRFQLQPNPLTPCSNSSSSGTPINANPRFKKNVQPDFPNSNIELQASANPRLQPQNLIL